MARRYLLAIDQGTTSSRAVVFDGGGKRLAMAQRELTQHYPKPGWVQHDPEEIWSSVVETMREALTRAGVGASELAGIGITNQRETTVVWERVSGRPIHPAIVWQSRQSAPICEELRQAGHNEWIRRKTGLVLDAYFSASKLRWLFDHVPGSAGRAARGELAFGTVDSWLIYKLTGGKVHATDVTNAARTLLLNIDTLQWDAELLALFDLPAAILPEVRASDAVFGELADGVLDQSGIPIAGVAGDQHAALFGQACIEPGSAKNTYGTGCFLLCNTGPKRIASTHGLLSTLAWRVGGETAYALEGSVFIAGAAIQWLRDGLGLVDDAAQSEALAHSVDSTDGVYFVPAFVGLGAPYWDDAARGLICGLTRGTTRAHLVRAALEAMAYQTRAVLDAMGADMPGSLKRLRVDGGASANAFLLQFQADLLGVAVERPVETETTVQGAAYLLGLATGVWGSVAEVAGLWRPERVFTPAWDQAGRAAALAGWQAAVDRART